MREKLNDGNEEGQMKKEKMEVKKEQTQSQEVPKLKKEIKK